ncbi:MAG: ATP synthase subunit I [Terriglobales bacterium]
MEQAPASASSSEAFYSGAYERIGRFMLFLAVVTIPILWLRYGRGFGVACAGGCAIGVVNFYWLKRTVSALADRATQSGQAEKTRGVVARFLLRYVLISLGVYAIFRSSEFSVYGLLSGLFLPVGAIACEAAYEAYVAVRRGV